MQRQSNTRTRQSSGEPPPEHDRLLAVWNGASASIDLPTEGRLIIGRAEDCDFRIEHPSVSRHHAAVHVGNPVRIEDLGSSNGTMVAGKRLEPHHPSSIAPDTLVRVGEVVVILRSAEVPPDASSPELIPPAETGPGALWDFTTVAAVCSLPVVILGETGVGKGVLAEAIHQRSLRAKKPFVRINCAALPEALLESELFGHERGAFTGAVQTKPGLLDAADAGTLLLDEVGEMPLGTQAKLLHVVENGELLRLGGLRPRKIDVRFISATNRDLDALVAAGQFRRDLYFRLAGLTIKIPPLRERRSEIPPLAQSFLEGACARAGKPVPALSEQNTGALVQHPWPGNVRELKNMMERMALTGRLDLRPMDAGAASDPAPRASEDAILDPKERMQREMRELEKQRIIEALARCAGSQTKAARQLGIARRTLTKRLDEFRLPRPRKV